MLRLAWVFDDATGEFRATFNLNAQGLYGGEPFRFNMRDVFTESGGSVTLNCHDGLGPQTFGY